MKFVKSLFACVALAASVGAQAQVTGALGGGAGTFLLLSSPAQCTLAVPCTLTGSVNAEIVGGTILNSDQPFADIPKGAIAGGNFLSAGPTTTEPSTVTFDSGIDYISFLWGSPDTFNLLTVGSTAPGATSQNFTAMSLGFPVTNGDQSFSQYVQFTGLNGSKITSLTFSSSIDAFESANYSVTPIPEPETYALMLAGLGVVGFIARRRQKG